MIRKLTLALLGLTLSTAVSAAERPALRSEAIVTDAVVRIGDLIDNAGVVANVPVFRAPALGQTGTVSASQVLDAVRAHALVGLDPGPISEITVTRASRVIAPNQIERLLTAALEKSYGLGNAADISVTFERPLRAFHAETTATGQPRIDRLLFDARTGRFSGTLTIAGAHHARLRLIGTAAVTTEIVQLLRPIARGDIIKMSDIALRRMPRSQVTSATITDPDQAIGMAARSPINAGRPVRSNELMKPELVQRSENVTIVYQVPGLMLAARGKAADSGAEGDMIDVTNLQTNRTVRATVIGPGRVAVTPMIARVIAAAEIPFNRSKPHAGAK